MKKLSIAVGCVIATAVLIYFFFAPAFRGDFEIASGFSLGNFYIRYYGLILGAAIIAAFSLARVNAWRFGLGQDEVDRFCFWLIIICFLCARIYFVIFEFQYFSQHPSEILQIWQGGLSIFGAILGGLVFIYLYSRNKAYTVWQVLDLVALALPLGQAIGRLGNFFNYEAYGKATNLPWKMFVPEQNRLLDASFYHPTFLYEALGSLIILLILFYFRGKVKSGNLALIYLMSYSLLRFAIEPLRMDSVFLGSFRADQVIALLVFVGSLWIWFFRRKMV